jgi:intraflagellar transport protein 172
MFNMSGLNGPDAYSSWAKLRNMLLRLTEAMKTSSDAGSAIHDDFDTLLVISHYYAARCAYKEVKTLDHLVAKLSTSLLRHTDIVPADKAFFEAGVDCRAVGHESEAFVFLNHYLDLCEAIEEGNVDLLDYSDFTNTDFPMEIPLPAALHVASQEHEEVKEWVLAISMDQKVDQVLLLDERGLTPSSLTSPNRSGPRAIPCVVSGYPVMSHRGRNPVEFKRLGKQANRDDWNKLMMAAKMAPETQITDVLSFIAEWCGGAPSFSFQ